MNSLEKKTKLTKFIWSWKFQLYTYQSHNSCVFFKLRNFNYNVKKPCQYFSFSSLHSFLVRLFQGFSTGFTEITDESYHPPPHKKRNKTPIICQWKSWLINHVKSQEHNLPPVYLQRIFLQIWKNVNINIILI